MSTSETQRRGNPVRVLLHVPVPWVFVLTYLTGVIPEVAWPLHFATATPAWITLAGGSLFLIGAVIAGWGLITFRRVRTTTVPGRASIQMVTWGPYRFTRNPMYAGLTLAYLGEAGILHQIWPVITLPLCVAYVNWIVIPVEEAKLTEVFGDTYRQYQSTVRRWL
jgi:protein-S-isoprenylcysteine O-methyltransferase Ste14